MKQVHTDYEAPRLTRVGSMRELTLGQGWGGNDDSLTWHWGRHSGTITWGTNPNPGS